MICKIILVICAVVTGGLTVANLKSHDKYSRNVIDDNIKFTLALDWLVMIVLFIYLIYKLVTL